MKKALFVVFLLVLLVAPAYAYDHSMNTNRQYQPTQTIVGQGGLVQGVNTIPETVKNGNILGTVRTIGAIYLTFKNRDIRQIGAIELETKLLNTLNDTPNLGFK